VLGTINVKSTPFSRDKSVKASNLAHIFLRPYKTNSEGLPRDANTWGTVERKFISITWSQDKNVTVGGLCGGERS